MKLIDKRLTEIVAGYDDILRAETELRSRWRPALIAAYARQRQAQIPAGIRQKRLLSAALTGIALLLIGLVIFCSGLTSEEALALGACCGGPLLSLLGLLILGAAGFSHYSGSRAKSGQAPLHPLRDGLYPDLRAAWLQGLSGDLKEEIPDYPGHYGADQKDYGAEGERQFVRRLLGQFDARYFALAHTCQRRGEDVDLILIGPQGVWVFEVKHWSGEIYWDESGWRRVRRYFERGGVEVVQETPVEQPPDQQWRRAAAEVARTLQTRAPAVLERYPALGKVRGGLVFTHPEGALKFQAGRPVYWGTLGFWLKTLTEFASAIPAEAEKDLDTRSALQLAEALLARHQQNEPAAGPTSMQARSRRAYAQGLVREAEVQLGNWVTGD